MCLQLLDSENSQISAVSFNKTAENFDFIQEDKVYIIRNGSIKLEKPDYKLFDTEFQIILNENTEIRETLDDGHIPRISFDFTTFDKLESISENEILDVIGIIVEIYPMIECIGRNGNQLVKRYIKLIDDTYNTIDLSL